MAFPSVRSYANVDPITALAIPPIGHLFHSTRVNQGPARGSWIYNFYATGTATPQNVYQNGALTVPFAPTGQVTADAFGRFPAIYVDNSVAYKVTLSNAAAVVQQTRDPYNPAMATTGFAQIAAAIGLVINAQGEITMTEAGAGGTGIELSIPAGLGGALKIQGITPGVATLTADSTVTTGAQTATFAATNMPPTNSLQISATATVAPVGAGYVGGTLTASFTGITSSAYTIVLSTGQVIFGATFTNGSTAFVTPSTTISGTPSATFTVSFSLGVVGWLPIQADGVLYYTPLFHASAFTPYKFLGAVYQGQTISAAGFTFLGNGNLTLSGGGALATPAVYYSPPQAGIGTTTWFQPTVTNNGGFGGLTFINSLTGTGSALPGSWTNIAGSLAVGATGNLPLVGTYQLSSSVTGVPVVANGTITLSGGNGVQQQNLSNGFDIFNTDGTITSQGGSTPTNWFAPSTGAIGNGFFVNVTQSGGSGTWAGDATGAGVWDALTSSRNFHANNGPVSGNYQISTTASTVGLLAAGTITAGNVSGSAQAWSLTGTCLGSISFKNDGTTSAGWPSWYSPTTASIGSSYWIKVHVVSITGGGSIAGITADTWTALSGASLSISLSLPGDMKCTYQISTASGGTPVVAEGTFEFANNC